jgi:hypothetical protein
MHMSATKSAGPPSEQIFMTDGNSSGQDGSGHRSLVSADIAVIADFSSPELAWRLEAETQTQSALGYRTVFVHLASNRQEMRPVHPDLNSCVAQGLAQAIDPANQVVRARLALIREPDSVLKAFVTGELPPLPRILADRVVCIASRARPRDGGTSGDPRIDAFVKNAFGATTLWAAESEEVQAGLQQAGLRVLDELWRPSAAQSGTLRGQQPIKRVAPVIGCAGPAASAWWRANPSEMKAALSVGGQSKVRLLLMSRTGGGSALPDDWEILTADDMGLRRFLQGLDFFVFCPARKPDESPVLVIAAALSLGIPTILHPSLHRFFGDGPRYAELDEIPDLVRELHGDDQRYREASQESAGAAAPFGPEVHRTRLRVLLGDAVAPEIRQPSAERRVLFVSSNGVGLGHLTRQLAIARRLPPSVSAVFATMSQGFAVAEQSGFPVEYIPFVTQSGFDLAQWDVWLAEQLCQIVDFHDIAGLVFDGVMPFGGLIEALRRRRNLSATWVRRPMWRRERKEHHLPAQRFFNLIIEPGEIAASHDQGATRDYRGVVMPVPPVRLLDEEELYDRTTAAERLDLDPDRPAVLIQLGAGANHDIVSLIDMIVTTLKAHPEVQPVIAEWRISALPLELWPDVRRLRTFPLARYFSAFDFTISATGYNSFHEIVAHGLPAIFLANPNQVMDDQVQRAAFAEEHGAAIVLPQNDAPSLQMAIETLLQERARWFLSANCRRLAQANGAAMAAEAIAATVYA